MKRVLFFLAVILVFSLLYASQHLFSEFPSGGVVASVLDPEYGKIKHDHMEQLENKNWCEIFHDFVKRSAADGAFLLRSAGDIRITGLAPGYAIVLIELKLRAPKLCDTHSGPCSPGSNSGSAYCSYSVIKRQG